MKFRVFWTLKDATDGSTRGSDVVEADEEPTKGQAEDWMGEEVETPNTAKLPNFEGARNTATNPLDWKVTKIRQLRNVGVEKVII